MTFFHFGHTSALITTLQEDGVYPSPPLVAPPVVGLADGVFDNGREGRHLKAEILKNNQQIFAQQLPIVRSVSAPSVPLRRKAWPKTAKGAGNRPVLYQGVLA